MFLTQALPDQILIGKRGTNWEWENIILFSLL